MSDYLVDGWLEVTIMLMRTDPFRDLDRLAQSTIPVAEQARPRRIEIAHGDGHKVIDA
ncbi:hypothetical protein [Nocardia amikacinitolerans]|uniref:hypothetical protein n=1 Tax=Nocardia amikacinitolerans TaxID=756689 RepID=UPI0020A5613B|nr:hypothetical protein [Nocardia amikacinitolerans]